MVLDGLIVDLACGFAVLQVVCSRSCLLWFVVWLVVWFGVVV